MYMYSDDLSFNHSNIHRCLLIAVFLSPATERYERYYLPIVIGGTGVNFPTSVQL